LPMMDLFFRPRPFSCRSPSHFLRCFADPQWRLFNPLVSFSQYTLTRRQFPFFPPRRPLIWYLVSPLALGTQEPFCSFREPSCDHLRSIVSRISSLPSLLLFVVFADPPLFLKSSSLCTFRPRFALYPKKTLSIPLSFQLPLSFPPPPLSVFFFLFVRRFFSLRGGS